MWTLLAAVFFYSHFSLGEAGHVVLLRKRQLTAPPSCWFKLNHIVDAAMKMPLLFCRDTAVSHAGIALIFVALFGRDTTVSYARIDSCVLAALVAHAHGPAGEGQGYTASRCQ